MSLSTSRSRRVYGAGTEVVLHRELGERPAALGDVGDAAPDDVRGIVTDDLVAGESHRALGVDHPRDRTKGGRLAGTVRAEHHDDLALVDPQVQAAQHRDRAVAGDETGHLEQAHVPALRLMPPLRRRGTPR